VTEGKTFYITGERAAVVSISWTPKNGASVHKNVTVCCARHISAPCRVISSKISAAR